MNDRFWSLLSRTDARIILLLVAVASGLLLSRPTKKIHPAEPAPAEPDQPPGPVPEPTPSPQAPQPLQPDVVPFSSPFLEQILEDGIPAFPPSPPPERIPEPARLPESSAQTPPANTKPAQAPSAQTPPANTKPAPRPVTPAPPEPDSAKAPPLSPDLVVTYHGLFVRPDGKAFALVERSDTGRELFYAEGEALGSLVIERFDRQTLTLRQDETRHTLERGGSLPVPRSAHE